MHKINRDNFTKSNRENSNIAITMLGNKQFDRTIIISHFRSTNTISSLLPEHQKGWEKGGAAGIYAQLHYKKNSPENQIIFVSSWLWTLSYFHHLNCGHRSGFLLYCNSQIVKKGENSIFVGLIAPFIDSKDKN